MSDKRDFVCGVCGGEYFWVKHWDQSEPGWFVLCEKCKELYQLVSDGTSKRLVYMETN